MRKAKLYFLAFCVFMLASFSISSVAIAETKTLSWGAVNTYTDGSSIAGSALPVTYDAWWSTSNTFVTPHTLLSSGTATSVAFDVGVQGMIRGTNVYFGARARTALNEVSVDSSPFSWLVPNLVLQSIAINGASSVNESSTSTYTATATWNDNSITTVTPTWSVSPTTYASISSVGVLTTLSLTGADQQVTITASYTADGVTKTATKVVTIVNSTRPSAPTGLSIN